MKKIRLYLQESFQELVHKVTWPSWKELQNSAIIVMVATLIISVIIFAMDFSLEHILRFLYNAFF